MIKKRGPIVGLVGVGLLMSSFLVVLSVIPNFDSSIQGEQFLPDLFQDIFDEVSSEVQIFPQESYIFSFTSSKSEVPLIWGFQNIDYQTGDEFIIKVSNILGEELGNFQQDGPILMEMFVISKNEIYNFEVANIGDRPITVVMMFSEDPDNSKALSDPNSPIVSTLMPLALSGMILLVGIIVVIVGILITIMDWKKGQNRPRYI